MTNPVFKNFGNDVTDRVVQENQIMTVNGTLQIALLLGLIMLIGAGYVWSQAMAGYTDQVMMLTSIGGIGGFILALIVCFTKSKYLIPVYAGLEGLFLGGISSIFETQYPGIVMQAVAGTFAAFFAMLILYRANIIRCTDKFRSVIFIGTASIAGIYLVSIIGGFFGYTIPQIHTSSNIGIAFSIIAVLFAAFNLILDFDFIEQGAQKMLPKDYEWFGAFGLMVTLVWLYLEMLKLLAKLSDRR